MRWKLVLAVPVLMLLALVTDAVAQDDVPLTMTMEAGKEDKHPADAVTFKVLDDEGNEEFVTVVKKNNERYQKLVGNIGPTTNDKRETVYPVWAAVSIGGSTHTYQFSFGAEDTCTSATSGKIARIACSLVRYGGGLVCSAIYEGMGEPKEECNSRACIYCGHIRVCGSDPLCD